MSFAELTQYAFYSRVLLYLDGGLPSNTAGGCGSSNVPVGPFSLTYSHSCSPSHFIVACIHGAELACNANVYGSLSNFGTDNVNRK